MSGRIFERKKRQMPCTVTLDGHHYGGLILDVSPGGLYIQSSAKMKPGDQVEVQMTIPGMEGRHRLHVEVVRKVIVPQQLLKVAHGGVGVRIVNAPEAYYQFMDSLGVTTDSGTSRLEQLENRRARGASSEADAASRPKSSARVEIKSKAERGFAPESAPQPETQAEAPGEPAAPQLRFRVRIKQAQGPRSRVLDVEAENEEDARSQAVHAAGAGWIVLGVERADAG